MTQLMHLQTDEQSHRITQYYPPAMWRVRHIHFVGIGGAGMGGIAEVLFTLGYVISGSDLKANAMTDRLQSLGVTIYLQHNAENIIGADVVVRSTAITSDNIELDAAKSKGIPIIRRAEMLAELMRFRYGIAISGTHGKTTTTSLVASILAEGGFDPTFVIGGLLNSAGTNAKLGAGQFFVAEADESDASFLHLKPMITIVTNIDADHLETYNNNFEQLKTTFINFIHHLPFYGLAVVCIVDETIADIVPEIARPTLTYGFSEQAHLQIVSYKQHELKNYFTLWHKPKDMRFSVVLNMPGRHNVLNAVAAIAVALELGIEYDEICNALEHFAGVGRRLQNYGDIQFKRGKATVFDDYGHHPRELAVTIQAIRQAWPKRRLVMAFQPHRYSRTKALFDDFVTILSDQCDALVLLDVYSAGEKIDEHANGETLWQAIKNRRQFASVFVPSIKQLPKALNDIIEDDDILLLQGAGDIGSGANMLHDATQSDG